MRKYRETERQRDRETERQRDREKERQRDRETERQRDRETEKREQKYRDVSRTENEEKILTKRIDLLTYRQSDSQRRFASKREKWSVYIQIQSSLE